MPKRKAKGVSSDETGSASYKSGSGLGTVGDSVSSVLVPSGTNIVWQLEEEAKNAWHVYSNDVQVSVECIVDTYIYLRGMQSLHCNGTGRSDHCCRHW